MLKKREDDEEIIEKYVYDYFLLSNLGRNYRFMYHKSQLSYMYEAEISAKVAWIVRV